MANILPFQRTGVLISEIDEYLDKISEAVMVLERTFAHYVDSGPDEELDERLEEIFDIESRGDDLRRSIATVMFTQMLMPDTRGDVLSLLDELDTTLDDCTHTVIGLAVERPELPPDTHKDYRALMAEAARAADQMVRAARAYFKEPHAVRDYAHKIGLHERETTKIGLRLGRQIFDSELPLEVKRQLADWLVNIRRVASHAHDVGDIVSIYAVKRSL